MNTLELMVEKVLKDNGYIATPKIVEASAEYIDMVNENKDDSEPIYTPEKWLEETKASTFGKEELKTKIECCYEVCDYLAKQRERCIDETGCQLDVEDFREHFECDEFKDRFGDYNLTLNDILNFLLVYYDNEGCIDVDDTDLI